MPVTLTDTRICSFFSFPVTPASSAAFHVSPKSLQLIFVVAGHQPRVLPHESSAASFPEAR